VQVPFTWKVTGWFMIGWSPEFPTGEVRPLHYFGEDLVAYRDEYGELHVLEAHCKHLGAHIDAGLAALADEARRIALPNIGRLLPAARAAGVGVVHCLVQRRPDGLGANHNAKIFAIGRGGTNLAPGGPGATLLPELGPEPTDLVLSRWHGVGPMGGTDLDPVLRNLGVSTIVAVGVSLNVAIPSLVMDAVNAAYRVVLPRDAVAGVPADYGAAVIDNTLSLLATVASTDDLLRAWTPA
jgi:nicotinamidase-related amidase